MLMYLNDREVVALLRKIVPTLNPGGMILCRETTVREGVVIRSGEYQATYRSIDVYRKLFADCRLAVTQSRGLGRILTEYLDHRPEFVALVQRVA